jgi:PAS domain S-box-containing protein
MPAMPRPCIGWEEFAQAVFEEADDALFVFDPETEQLLEANPMGQRLSGFSRKALQEMRVPDVLRPEEPESLQRLRLAFGRMGVFHSQDGFWLRTGQEGGWLPVNLTVTRLHLQDGACGLITARDVREQRAAHAQLARMERELRRVLSSVSDCLWSAEIDTAGQWTFCYFSPAVATITHRPEEFFLGDLAQWLDVLHPEDRLRAEQDARRLRVGRSLSGEYRLVWPDGAVRWVRFNARMSRGDQERPFVVDGVLSDITEYRQAEDALRASEAKHRTLIENLPQGVFLKDRSLRFTAVNGPFCQDVGRAEADVLGKTDFDLFPAPLAEQFAAADRMVLSEDRRVEREERIELHGKVRTVQVVKTPVHDNRGRVAGVLGIFWDVTEQRQLEAHLRQAHKMEAMGQLASGIAHDFNNLLTAVVGNLELAQGELPAGHPGRDLLANSVKAGFRAAELTRQLLSFARRTPLRPAPLSLNQSVEQTVRLLRHTFDPRITVEVRLEPSLWLVQADAAQIDQVLMNLCLNARDAMAEGGRLTLTTANLALDLDAVRPYPEGRPGEFVRLRVEDSGQGMTPEVRAHLFEPFFTTKAVGKGTGLGLATVFGIVQQHRGWIACRSAVGAGTAFEVYLPRLATAVIPAPVVVDKGGGSGSETILVADDQDMVRTLVATILQRHGYRALTAADGAQAVELYRQRQPEIALVILDLAMPVLSGKDALLALREVNPAVRVLISSGYISDETARDLERAGAAGFVAKPYHAADLARKVRTVLDRGK